MATGNRRRIAAMGAGAATLVLVTSGCLQSDAGGGGGASSGDDGDGTVTILGAFGGAEKTAFEASLAGFEEESGINVEYTEDTDFTTTVVQRVGAGDAPDIGLFPQPGGLLDLSEEMTPLDEVIDIPAIEETLIPGFLDSATAEDGTVYGAPMRMAVKSIVWYPKSSYDAAGYATEAATFQELMDLSDEIRADGTAPWCMGWESDQATGWVGTDWLEEMVLRAAGPDVYDQWVSHEIPFNDPRIAEALDAFGELAKGDGLVLGGSNGILNTSFADAMTPAFGEDPNCYLHRQGNFATGFYPEDVRADLDGNVGTFYFPQYEGGYDGQPILGGGDLAATFNGDDEEVQEVMTFLTSDEFGAEWAAAGGWLSPHSTFDTSSYSDDTTRAIAQMAADADVFRFDGSDLMPAAVGSGSFWTEMVKWQSGQSTQDTLDAIEASWPAS